MEYKKKVVEGAGTAPPKGVIVSYTKLFSLLVIP